MKHLIAAVLLSMGMSAQASDIFTMGVNCGETEEFMDFFAKYKLLPIYYSDNSQILNPDGEPLEGELTVWVSQDGNFATLFTVRDSGKSCLTSVAEDTIEWTAL